MSQSDLILGAAPFHILLALANGPCHGYAAMRVVREQSGGRVPLQTGSFYWHLTRLLDQGLVAVTSPRPSGDSRRGAHYRLTQRGQQVLARELRYLRGLVATHSSLVAVARKGHA